MASNKALRVAFGDWDDVIADAYAIREEVFVEEQGIPAELEFDELDSASLHTVVYAGLEAVGTGRLLADGHIGRIAVRADSRGRGVGAAILQGLMEQASKRGDKAVALNAQIQAAPFYERFGFQADGAPFDEAGIPHIAMTHRFA